jgi:hypothetical protein
VRRVAVTEGFSEDDHVEVIPAKPESLAPGDLIAVVGNRDLEDGDAVEAAPWAGAGSPAAQDPGASDEQADDA